MTPETTASLYRPSFRPSPERIPQLEYPAHFERRRVSRNGGTRWGSGWVNVSHVLEGEYMGLEAAKDGVRAVCFGPLLSSVAGRGVPAAAWGLSPYQAVASVYLSASTFRHPSAGPLKAGMSISRMRPSSATPAACRWERRMDRGRHLREAATGEASSSCHHTSADCDQEGRARHPRATRP
jgi:hypothetical protein